MKQRLKLLIRSLASNLAKKLMGPHVSALVTKTEMGLFLVDIEDCVVGRQLRKTGSYGTSEINQIKHHIHKNSRILVVGAHIGTLAIPLSQRCEEVIAIEANPETYQLLVNNIALNLASNCRAINIAANNKEETIEFLLSRTNSGGSKRVPKQPAYMYYYDQPEQIKIKAYCLDQYLDNTEFDVVIMDIEGSEYFALQGMQEILSKTKVLVIEFLPHHLKNVSGHSVSEFLALITPHFSKLTIPSKQKTLRPAEFNDALSKMYDKEEGDDGIIFEKI